MNNKFKWISWGACILVLLFISFMKLPIIQFVIDEQTYILTDDTFQLQWIHSVEKEEWVEVYERDHNQLLLSKTILQTFGAGTPSEGSIIPSDDNRIHMEINRHVDDINLIVSVNVQTTVITKQKTIPLYTLTDDYTNIIISVERVHIWDYLGGKRLNERSTKQ